MKKWRAFIRVENGKIGTESDGRENILERFDPDSVWDTLTDRRPSVFGGRWYKVEVTSDELGMDDDGNPI